MPLRKALSQWFDAVRRVSICLAISAFMVGPSLSQTVPEQIDSVVSDQNEIIRRYSAPRKPTGAVATTAPSPIVTVMSAPMTAKNAVISWKCEPEPPRRPQARHAER